MLCLRRQSWPETAAILFSTCAHLKTPSELAQVGPIRCQWYHLELEALGGESETCLSKVPPARESRPET